MTSIPDENMTDSQAIDRADRMIERSERLVAAESIRIDAKFQDSFKQMVIQINGNKEQSEARIDSVDKLSETRTKALRDSVDANILGLRERSDERWIGFKTQVTIRSDQIERDAEKRNADLRDLLYVRLDGEEKAREWQNAEWLRRFEEGNHKNDFIADQNGLFVRKDVYDKDMERIYTERQEQQRQAAAARESSNIAEASNRQQRMITMIMATIAMISVIVAIIMPFIKGARM